jgi:hypothetical protein
MKHYVDRGHFFGISYANILVQEGPLFLMNHVFLYLNHMQVLCLMIHNLFKSHYVQKGHLNKISSTSIIVQEGSLL